MAFVRFGSAPHLFSPMSPDTGRRFDPVFLIFFPIYRKYSPAHWVVSYLESAAANCFLETSIRLAVVKTGAWTFSSGS
ncbi:MAG: hypothetical protein V1792_07770 [Pseudomonadota bacterium]